MKRHPERRDVPAERLEGLRYTFVEDDDEHGPYFKILDGQTLIAYAVRRAAALQITRALNREDLRVFAARAKPPAPKRRGGLSRSKPETRTLRRPTPRRRFRSKRKL
jgi:hypothetical protein